MDHLPIADSLHGLQQKLIQQSCAETHSKFLKKCQIPLWTNKEFFISLPFKRNEDVNPIKESYSGMHPDHYKLAVAELNQLKTEGLIESTSSQWACEAFYVNKKIKVGY